MPGRPTSFTRSQRSRGQSRASTPRRNRGHQVACFFSAGVDSFTPRRDHQGSTPSFSRTASMSGGAMRSSGRVHRGRSKRSCGQPSSCSKSETNFVPPLISRTSASSFMALPSRASPSSFRRRFGAFDALRHSVVSATHSGGSLARGSPLEHTESLESLRVHDGAESSRFQKMEQHRRMLQAARCAVFTSCWRNPGRSPEPRPLFEVHANNGLQPPGTRGAFAQQDVPRQGPSPAPEADLRAQRADPPRRSGTTRSQASGSSEPMPGCAAP